MVKTNKLEGVTVSEETIETLNRTLHSLEELESQLPQFLSDSDPEFLPQLPLLQRAQSLFNLAKLTSTLFSLKLRCRGVNPNDHPFKSELDRLSVFQKRLDSLPDLSEEQWQYVMNKGREEEPKMNDQEQAGQKRKHPSSDATEFQGSNSKETIVIDISDDDDKF